MSILLFGAMTLADTRFFYLEQEELLEICEGEREELKEKPEEGGKYSSKWLLSNGADYATSAALFDSSLFVSIYIQEASKPESNPLTNHKALFIMNCCLKIPLADLIR